MNVFLTGASSGIGLALAREYARRGARLGMVARRATALAELAAELGPQHITYAVDVHDREVLIGAGRHFDAATGGADIVIANAGISAGVETEHFEDLDTFRDVFETNVLAVAHTFHPFIAAMRERRRGILVGIGSVAGVRGMPGSEAYCASKSAVATYCESLRVGLCGSGVRVLLLAPGFVRTPLTGRNPYPMPFLMDPDDFARSAAKRIARGGGSAVIPWQMGIVARLLRALPDALFDRAFAGRKRKPRRGAGSAG